MKVVCALESANDAKEPIPITGDTLLSGKSENTQIEYRYRAMEGLYGNTLIETHSLLLLVTATLFNYPRNEQLLR